MRQYPCSVCGTPTEMFECHREKNKYVFCSTECRKTPFIPKRCAECGEVFLSTAQAIAQAKFCSGDCRNARNRREETHKKSPKVTLTCERCGELFQVRRSVGKVQRYCSQKCSGAAIGESHKGENSPVWKPKIKVVCDYCGKEFETYPSRQGRRKYCCKEHRSIGNLQRLASAPRTDIEIAMAQALCKHRIEFDEQVPMFGKFLVDFKLRNHSIIIQCDGTYWHDRPGIRTRDKGQDWYLAKAGFIVLRFNDKEILNQINNCIVRIKQAIKTGQIPLINY